MAMRRKRTIDDEDDLLVILHAVAVVALLAMMPRTAALLDPSEIAALMELAEHVYQFSPNLGNTSWRVDLKWRDDPSASWPTTWDEWRGVCEQPYAPYGLICKNGHIYGMNCTYFQTWGDINDDLAVTSLQYLSGLIYLKEFWTTGEIPPAVPLLPIDNEFPNKATKKSYDLLSMLLSTSSIALERVMLTTTDAAASAIPPTGLRPLLESHSTLRELRFETYFIDGIAMNLAQLTNLSSLHYLGERPPPPTQFSTLETLLNTHSSPHQLDFGFNGSSLVTLDGFENLPRSIRALTIANSSALLLFRVSPPPSLASLTIIQPLPPHPQLDLSDALDLKELVAYGVQVSGHPPNLTTFICHECYVPSGGDIECSPSLTSSLETLDVNYYISHGTRALPPTLGNCRNLKHLRFIVDTLSLSPLTLSNVKLETLEFNYGSLDPNKETMAAWLGALNGESLKRLRIVGSTDTAPSLPNLARFTQLEDVFIDLSKSTGYTEPWEFHLPNLRSLTVNLHPLQSGLVTHTDLDWRTAAPNLTRLDLGGVGLHDGLWSQLPKALSHLVLLGNGLTGTIPHNFFVEHPHMFLFGISTNRVFGTFPWYGWTNLRYLLIQLTDIEDLPSIYGGAPNLMYLILDRNFALTTFPDDYSFDKSTKLLELRVTWTPLLRGPVPAFWSNLVRISQVRIENVGFEGTLPQSINSRLLESLLISDADSICGSLPTFTQRTHLWALHLSNLRINGTIPVNWQENLAIMNALNLLGTPIDVCGGTSPLDFGPTSICSFPTDGATCQCAHLWNSPAGCTESCPPAPPPPTPPPVFTCSTPPARPSAQPPPLPPSVIIVSQPTTVQGDLILPPSTTVVFQGLVTLNVTGCISLPHVTVELGEEEIEKIGKAGTAFTAVSSGSGLCKIGDTVPKVDVKKTKPNCKQVKGAPKMESTNLNVLLTVSATPCRLWWIITIPVVVGSVIIITVIIILVVALRPSKISQEAELLGVRAPRRPV